MLTVFGGRAFEEGVKVDEGIRVGLKPVGTVSFKDRMCTEESPPEAGEDTLHARKRRQKTPRP